MSDDSTYKYFYGKNYKKALRLKGNEKKHLKENFVKKYPYADLSRFRFVASVGPDLKNVEAKIEFVTNENYFIDMRTSTFIIKNTQNICIFSYCARMNNRNFAIFCFSTHGYIHAKRNADSAFIISSSRWRPS